jgi:hypothetical protein
MGRSPHQVRTMKFRSRLKHAAAGLSSSFISRNNDLNGHWALGLLYKDAPPHTLALDLLSSSSQPSSDHASQLAERYGIFLRTALGKLDVEWSKVLRASVTLQFNAQVSDPHFHFPCKGDPVTCTVTLHSVDGLEVTASALARCLPFQSNVFSQSSRASAVALP